VNYLNKYNDDVDDDESGPISYTRINTFVLQENVHLKAIYCRINELVALCSKKSDAKIQITITTAYPTRIKYPFSGYNYHLSDVNVANFNKIHGTVSEQQQCYKNGTQKQKFPLWKIPIQNDRVYAPLGRRKRQVSAEHLLRTRSTFSKSVMVSVAVSILVTTELMFIEPGVTRCSAQRPRCRVH